MPDFGDRPLVVIGRDPRRTFLDPAFREVVGEDVARQLDDAWQAGLGFYAGLSSDAATVTAVGSAFEMILWEHPDLVARQVVDVIERGAPPGG